VLLPNGKFVAAGHTAQFFGIGDGDFALARYQSNGALDAGFGVAGKVVTDFGVAEDGVFALLRQADGKLVAAGFAVAPSVSGSSYDFALARYFLNGTLDPTFGVGGKVTTDFGDGLDIARSLTIEPSGKLIAAGEGGVPSFGDFALARYNVNGSLDGTFGSAGKVLSTFTSGFDGANAVVLQAGKIVTAGLAETGQFTQDYNFAIARFNINGSPDPTFGTGGKVTTDFGSNFAGATGLALQSGKIVAVGGAVGGGKMDFALARYLP
jgi:uncharacterized delta-60 repeat protein